MTNPPNNDNASNIPDSIKSQQIDKLNSMIENLQKTVDKLKNEVESTIASSDSANNLSDVQDAEPTSPSDYDNSRQHGDVKSSLPKDDDIQKENKPEKTVKSKGDANKSDTQSAEYVTPIFYTKRYKRNKKREYGMNKNRVIPQKTKTDNDNNNDDNRIDEFVFVVPHKKKRKRKSKKQKLLQALLTVVAVIVGLAIIAASCIYILNKIGESELHNYDNLNITPPDDMQDVSVDGNGRLITYKGHMYALNEKVTSCVILGVDKENLTDKNASGTSGQSDAIYIAVINTSTKHVTMLGVSRDAMVDVNTYDSKGNFIDTTNMQICLAYAYGNGKETSCENTMRSLERLFFGLTFNTYFSIDFDAFRTLNDQIGGVTLVSEISFTSKESGRTINEGEEVTLSGDEAQSYIQIRDVTSLKSNAARMDRQKQYMTSFLSQTLPAVKKDLTIVTDLYKCIDDNSTTNLNASKITYLTTTALSGLSSYKDLEFLQVPGEIKQGKQYAEFHTDDDALMQMMLDLFYVKIK